MPAWHNVHGAQITWHDVVLRVSPAAKETRVALTLDEAEFEGSAVIEDFASPDLPQLLWTNGREEQQPLQG